MKTKREVIEAYLTMRGYRRESPTWARSRRYTAWYGRTDEDTLWVGPHGAVRWGRTVSESVSVSHRFDAGRLRRRMDELKRKEVNEDG